MSERELIEKKFELICGPHFCIRWQYDDDSAVQLLVGESMSKSTNFIKGHIYMKKDSAIIKTMIGEEEDTSVGEISSFGKSLVFNIWAKNYVVHDMGNGHLVSMKENEESLYYGNLFGSRILQYNDLNYDVSFFETITRSGMSHVRVKVNVHYPLPMDPYCQIKNGDRTISLNFCGKDIKFDYNFVDSSGDPYSPLNRHVYIDTATNSYSINSVVQEVDISQVKNANHELKNQMNETDIFIILELIKTFKYTFSSDFSDIYHSFLEKLKMFGKEY